MKSKHRFSTWLTPDRLRGHRDQITNIRFLPSSNNLPSTSTSTAPGYLLTSGKDTFVKFWDLSTQHCVQTIVAHRSEVWSLDVNQDQDLFFTGSGEGEVKAWRIDSEALAAGLKETEAGEVHGSPFLLFDPNYEIFRLQNLSIQLLACLSPPGTVCRRFLSTQHKHMSLYNPTIDQ